MKKYIGCDMHKKYSVFVAMDENGRLNPAVKVSNDLLELRAYLATCRVVRPRWSKQLEVGIGS